MLEAADHSPDFEESTQELQIFALDVGQGDAMLLIGPNGQMALIDAGPPYSGISRILPELRSLEVDSIDWVLISHYDADHLGGLLEILRGEDQEWDTGDDIELIGSVWDRGGLHFDPSPWFDEYDDKTEEQGWRQTVQLGQSFDLGNGAMATVVLSEGDYLDGTSIHINPDEENEASIAILIEYGDFRYLTAGDLTGGGMSGSIETKDLETALAALVGDVDVLHLNHHGSRTGSNENYLDGLNPEAVIISVGPDNDYGHPHPEVLERLEKGNIPFYQTNEGTIQVSTDGQTFQIMQEGSIDKWGSL